MGVSNQVISRIVHRKRFFARAEIVDEILFELKCDRLDRDFALKVRNPEIKKTIAFIRDY